MFGRPDLRPPAKISAAGDNLGKSVHLFGCTLNYSKSLSISSKFESGNSIWMASPARLVSVGGGGGGVDVNVSGGSGGGVSDQR